MRKTFVLITLIFLSAYTTKGQTSFYDKADLFFKTYTNNGLVNYKAIKADSKLLDELVADIANADSDKQKSKSYLINAYNILVISKVVKHKTWVTSPMKINDFFYNKTTSLGGKKISLNTLENEMIRKMYNDPRVHFVLVCGALGCPTIASFAYRPEKLEQQLQAQTKKALNNSKFVYQKDGEKAIYLSQIFDWYKGDFGGSKKSAVEYINKYRSSKFNSSYKVVFYEYDWTLNNGGFGIKKKMTN